MAIKDYIKTNWRKIVVVVLLFLIASVLVIRYEKQSLSHGNDTVILTIDGEVTKPGSYVIKKGTSVDSNMSLFGGYTIKADLSKTDVYKPITENTSVSIKAKSASADDKNNYDSLYVLPD